MGESKLVKFKCKCGCGKSWKALPGSDNEYFSDIHKQANNQRFFEKVRVFSRAYIRQRRLLLREQISKEWLEWDA